MAGSLTGLCVALLLAVASSFVLEQSSFDNVHFSGNGETPDFWRTNSKANILKIAHTPQNVGVAKNVILFLGDGMSIPTVTASRIMKGQLAGHTGEEDSLSFDKFPVTGLSKTYCQDRQVTDSAASGTAYHCGVKTNIGVLGVDARTIRGNCASQQGGELTSILDWSMAAGKSVGFVTTTRVTHATPASLYANVADRGWEGDHYTGNLNGPCRDIALQLIEDYKEIKVIMGGGRRFFRPYNQPDPEHGSNAHYGRRDGRDLVKEWQTGQQAMGRQAHYVWNQTEFDKIDPATTDSIMGLFEYSHMQYEFERKDPNHEVAGEPSVAEMTEKAIKILEKNPNGYFLLVEGGNIDHGHHAGRAHLALHDTLAFSDAVEAGVQNTKDNETLIVVTADHAHVMTIAGYPSRGNPILEKVDNGGNGDAHASDGKPYTTLLYADGPGYTSGAVRPDLSHTDTTDKHYHQQAAVPMSSETHGGDDVAIFATGPMSHLLTGVHEENDIAHVMAYASCVGDYVDKANCAASIVH